MLVYYQEGGASKKDIKTIKPHVLVYENNDEKTVEDLMEYYANEIKQPEVKNQLVWELQAGYHLKRNTKMIDIKKELRKDNINGLIILSKVEDLSWTD